MLKNLVIGSLLITLAVWFTTALPPGFEVCAFDGKFYGAMAARASADAWHLYQAPWCWRVLTPFLVSLLPLTTINAFLVLNFLFGWINVLLIGWLAQRICETKHSGLAAMLLYAGIFWTLKFSFYCPCYVDVQTQTFFLGILCLLEAGRYSVIPWTIALGVLQKESVLLLAPVVSLQHYARHHDRKKALLLLVVVVTFAIIVLAAIRTSILPVNQYLSESAFRQQFVSDFMSLLELRAHIFTNLLSGLGLLWLIAIWHWKALAPFVRKQPHWVALIVLGVLPLFAGTDKGRFFLYMLPAVTVLAVYGLAPVLRAIEKRDSLVGLWACATLAVHLYMGHLLTAVRDPQSVFAWMGQWPALNWMDSYRPLLCALIWIILTMLLVQRRPALLTSRKKL